MKYLFIYITIICAISTVKLGALENSFKEIKNNKNTYHFRSKNDQLINIFYQRSRGHYTPFQYYLSLYKNKEKSKIIIFEKPTFEWLREKNRLEKLFIAIGAGTAAVGFGVLLAGLINLFVNFNAVSIDGEPIMNSYYTYYALIGVGSGLLATGAAFIIVGSVRLGIKKRKAKSEVSLLY